MDLANTLIDSMADKFDPSKYKDEYYEKVMEVIQKKLAGVAPAAPAFVAQKPGRVVDLMEILKQSLKETATKKKAEPVQPSFEETVTAGDGGGRAPKPKTRKPR